MRVFSVARLFFTTFKFQIALWVTVVSWASAFVFIRIGLAGFHPGSLAFFRYLIASVCMLIFYIFVKDKSRLSFLQILHLIGLGVIGIGLYNVFLNYGEITVPAGIAAFIVGMMPIFTILFAMVLLREKVAHKSWIGIAVSVIGMFLIALGESQGVHFDYGFVYLVMAAICGSYYSVGQKSLLKKIHSFEVALWAILGGTLAMAVFTPQLIQDLPRASGKAIFSAIYLGVVPAALGYTTWSYALSNSPASKAVLYLYTLPIIATLLGFIMLYEIPSLFSFLGGIVALIGAYVANYYYLQSKRKALAACSLKVAGQTNATM